VLVLLLPLQPPCTWIGAALLATPRHRRWPVGRINPLSSVQVCAALSILADPPCPALSMRWPPRRRTRGARVKMPVIGGQELDLHKVRCAIVCTPAAAPYAIVSHDTCQSAPGGARPLLPCMYVAHIICLVRNARCMLIPIPIAAFKAPPFPPPPAAVPPRPASPPCRPATRCASSACWRS
jgi:hypothetical protein